MDNINPNFDSEEEVPSQEENFEDEFSAMESALDDLPSGQFITLRHEANAPMYVQVFEGEPGLTIRGACDRRGLTLGGSVNAYVDNNPVPLDTFVPAGTVVTLVGAVKGGTVL